MTLSATNSSQMEPKQCSGSIPSSKNFTGRAGATAGDKPVKKIYESKDRGGGQTTEHDVTALQPRHISTVYSLHIPPWNRPLVLRIQNNPPALSLCLYLCCDLSAALLCLRVYVCVWMRPLLSRPACPATRVLALHLLQCFTKHAWLGKVHSQPSNGLMSPWEDYNRHISPEREAHI